MMGGLVTYKCACCGEPFNAKPADRARGWARFCSKRCKAIAQVRQRHGKPERRALPMPKAPELAGDYQAAEAMAARMFGWTP